MTPDQLTVTRTGLLRMGALALLWGSSFLWIELALRGFHPVQIAFARLLLGFAVLAPIALSRRLPVPRGLRLWGHLFVAALLANAVPYLLFGVAQETVGSNVAGVLNATTPLWTLVLAFLVGTDRAVSWTKAAGITLGFVGVLVLFSPWEAANEVASWGGLACLAAAGCYGVSYIYMGRHLTGQGIRPIVLSASQLGAATVLLALALPVAGRDAPTWRWDAVVSLLVLGVLGTGAAYVLNYRIIADEGATAASVVGYLLPIVAVALGWLVLDEAVSPAILAGVLLVLTGVVLSRRDRLTAGRVPPPAAE